MNKIVLKILILFPLFLAINIVAGQDPISDEETFEKRYAQNIKKSRINGVYIPADLDEAFQELTLLSTQEALAKFKSGEEKEVAKKLHFGIGRWMIYNWNFYEGSRFSHYLKELGLNHPDDMAQFVIVTFHRHLNDKPLNEEELVKYYQDERLKLRLEKENQAKVIKEESKIKQKNR